ncbi:hypothetical protein [Vulcanisaeta distributa]|uniref:hypothetical protein n=1 Tax=Vulcanisaeta distributa TaxID=164451 RepID=UPI0006D09852|nr:hypothetical protein [Vulcanisaeta distributa]
MIIPVITITPNATSYPATLLQLLNFALTVVSIAMALTSIPIALRTPVNRVGLITRGGEEP